MTDCVDKNTKPPVVEEEYLIVINHEEQYSIWPSYKEIPKGWNQVDKPGTKSQCLEYIKEHWTDMRPLSLRKAMEQSSQESETV